MEGVQLGSWTFRFEQLWTTKGECEDVITNSWVGGDSLGGKLESCIAELKSRS